MENKSEDFGYEPFADTEEYREVNRAIVRNWVAKMRAAGSRNLKTVLDLATGVGTMTELLLEAIPGSDLPEEVVCVDMNAQALEEAERNLKGRVRNLRLVHATLQKLSLEVESVDAAIWGNGIHYLSAEEQQEACRNVRRTVKKNGWFFF
ncbi:MAG TPA: class I SAM-dependent methyltransferase, partial [Spirochaetia bacterium]|nr:class I SAM-dependent methyltransferase [Spirochaetia bacterium]